MTRVKPLLSPCRRPKAFGTRAAPLVAQVLQRRPVRRVSDSLRFWRRGLWLLLFFFWGGGGEGQLRKPQTLSRGVQGLGEDEEMSRNWPDVDLLVMFRLADFWQGGRVFKP